MMNLPSECPGPGTFTRGRWVGIRLYDGRKVSVPVEIPAWYELEDLTDLELLTLFVLVSTAATGRGHSVNGWPKWAQEVAEDTGKWPNREELSLRLYAKAHGRTLDGMMKVHASQTPLPTVDDLGRVCIPGSLPVSVTELVDDSGHLQKGPWLRQF